jgi:hypothetical protein
MHGYPVPREYYRRLARAEGERMSNKIGTAATTVEGRRYINVNFQKGLLELPDHLKDCPDGFIVYTDKDGRLQAMEGP